MSKLTKLIPTHEINRPRSFLCLGALTVFIYFVFNNFTPLANVFAEPVLIIHTNDLHSHLDHADTPEIGGYAAVKTKIDELKLEAESQGIPVLVLDAGDFTEGSEFNYADKGLWGWQAMSQMGYDAVTLGNHDWLQGLTDLSRVIDATQPGFSVLAANFDFDKAKFPVLGKFIKPSIELSVGQQKIAILGLTTSDLTYSWRARDGAIGPAIPAAWDQVPKLRSRNDFLIALTHIGYQSDIALAKKVEGIDLIVGGHSHTRLDQVDLTKNEKTHRPIPIVQTGSAGRYVGRLLVDLTKGEPVQVLSYQLVPIYSAEAKISQLTDTVEKAKAAYRDHFGPSWLSEIIGYSEVNLDTQGGSGPTTFSNLVADGMRESSKADVAFDMGVFEGFSQPAGPITRESLIKLYPRSFDFNQKYGWNIWTVKIRGWVLKSAIKLLAKIDGGFTFSGITYTTSSKGKLSNFKINGSKLKLLHNYTLAVPEGVGRGAHDIAQILKTILKNPTNTGIPVWTALEDQFRKHSPIKAIP